MSATAYDVLNPINSGVTVFGNKVVEEVIKLSMQCSGGALVSMISTLIWTQITQRDHCVRPQREADWPSVRRAERSQKKPNLQTMLGWIPIFQKCKKTSCCYFSPPLTGILLWQPWQKLQTWVAECNALLFRNHFNAGKTAPEGLDRGHNQCLRREHSRGTRPVCAPVPMRMLKRP